MERQIPEFLREKLLEQYGEQLTARIIEGYSKQRLVTLRVNEIKTNKERTLHEFYAKSSLQLKYSVFIIKLLSFHHGKQYHDGYLL